MSNLESLICSQALADSASGLSAPECERSPSVKSNHSAAPSSESTGPTCQSSRTLEPSQQQMFLGSMSSAVDSPARTLVWLEREQDLKGSAADYGGNTNGLLAKYDPFSSLWKTSQLCLDGELESFLETWPRSGMTVNGIAYQLPALVCPTLGTGHGLLPTIGKNEGKGSSKKRYRHSAEYRGAKMSEGLRYGLTDPIYTHPGFATQAMGFPTNWAHLEMPLSRKSPKSSDAQSSKRKG